MDETCFNERLGSTSAIILSVWLSFTGLAAITGNAIVLWLVYKHESLRTVSNRFVTSLAAADFLVGLVIVPAWITVRFLAQPSETSVLTKVLRMLWVHTTAATTFNLCCVSVDRFIAIRFPLRYVVILTKNICHSVIILVWFASILLPLLLIFIDVKKLWLSISIITFWVPTTVVLLCYFWIFKAARGQIRRMRVNSNEQNTACSAKKNYKALKTVGFVLGAFIASWMPCLILSITHQFAAKDMCWHYKYYVAAWPWIEAVAFASSSVNPWIYCFRNVDFCEVLHRRLKWFPQ